eukprot:2571786-Amphidinium_carterae.1
MLREVYWPYYWVKCNVSKKRMHKCSYDPQSLVENAATIKKCGTRNLNMEQRTDSRILLFRSAPCILLIQSQKMSEATRENARGTN